MQKAIPENLQKSKTQVDRAGKWESEEYKYGRNFSPSSLSTPKDTTALKRSSKILEINSL